MFAVSRLTRLLQLVSVLVCVSPANAQESWRSLPEKNEPLKIGVGLREDGSVGSYGWKKVDPPIRSARELGDLPGYGRLKFVWDGEYLTVHPLQDVSPKHVVDKDGWYLSGDYSTDPPRVILTKEKKTHSKWTFVAGKNLGDYILKNLSGPKGDAYLYLKDTGVRTPLGAEWEAIIYDVILTYNPADKTEMAVDNIKRNNGK